MMDDNVVALVTGGSRGIGKAICTELAAQKVTVYVNYASNSDAAKLTVEECRKYGGVAHEIQFNVADKTGVEAAIARIRDESGKLDVLVNNAGISHNSLLLRTKDEDWERVLETNLKGAFFCTRAALKLLLKSARGRIVNISSVVAEMGNPGQVAYVASKAGLIGMTKSLAKELGTRGITVNAVTPGFIETDMTKELDDAQKAHYLGAIALGKFGEACDVAGAVAFLVSPQARYITGQVLGVNGGLYM
jgi:3-oxoacyl-[acyl-carrier protein] reductase